MKCRLLFSNRFEKPKVRWQKIKNITANVLGLCEGRASMYKSSNLAQCLIVVQMFNKPLMPCFCKTLVMGSCFSGTQNLVK
jgi:hypothetical protein